MANSINEELVNDIIDNINKDLNKDERLEIIMLLKETSNLCREIVLEEVTNAHAINIIKNFVMRVSKRSVDYERNIKTVFNNLTRILDLLRGNNLQLIIQKTDFDSNGNIIGMRRYIGNEHDFYLGLNKEYGKIEDITYDLRAFSPNIEKQMQIEQKFINHYQQYYDKANKIIGNHKKKFTSKDSINEGHIAEAFYRHLKLTHGGFEINKQDSYSEDISYPEIAVELEYSRYNDAWWTGGDVELWQIKGNNNKLASFDSVQEIMNQLLNLFTNEKNLKITRQDFNKMFNREQQIGMTNPDEQTLEEALKKLDNLKTVHVDRSLF